MERIILIANRDDFIEFLEEFLYEKELLADNHFIADITDIEVIEDRVEVWGDIAEAETNTIVEMPDHAA